MIALFFDIDVSEILSKMTNFQIFLSFIVVFFISATIAYLFTPSVINLAHKIGAIDVPKDNRRVHKEPIPRLGGLAIAFGFFITGLLFFRFITKLFMIFLGAALIIISGVIDDTKGLSPKGKLAFQIAAALLVSFSGTRIEFLSDIFTPGKYFDVGMLSIPMTVFWIVGITNTVNLIDGLDGLAAGISAISSFCLMLIVMQNGDVVLALTLAALIGAITGFFPYNFNPAKIFMGDTGALFLGYILAVISMEAVIKSAATLAVFIPIFVLGIPIFDTSFAILRRAKARKPIMQADKGHLHHRLLKTGMNQKQAVLTLYFMSVVLGMSAYFIASSSYKVSIIVILIDIALILYTIHSLKVMDKADE